MIKIISIIVILLIISNFICCNYAFEHQVESNDEYDTSGGSSSNSSNINSLEKTIDINPSIQSLSSVELSNKIINFYSNIPRYSLNLSKVNNTFSPNSTQYIESIILTGFPFELVILITILSTIICLIIKCSFRIHRWRIERINSKRYKYLNIGNGVNSRKSIYHQKRKSSIKYTILIGTTIMLLVFVCSTSFVSIFINKDLDKAVLLSVNNLESHLSNRVDVENRIIEECKPITSIPYDAMEIVTTTKQILNITRDGKQYLHKYESIRYEFIFNSCLIIFGLVSIGLLSLILIRLKWIMISFIILGILIVVCSVWLIPSTHIPLGVLLSDICPNMDSIIENYAPESVNPYVYFFINCTGADNFDFIYGMLDDKIETTQNSLNRAKSHHFSNITINKLQTKLDDLIELSRDARDMLNCKITANTYKSTQQLICVDIVNSSFMLSSSFIVIGILLSISFINLLIIYSRSNSTSLLGNDDGDDDFDNYGNYEQDGDYYKISKSKNIQINNDDYKDGSILPLLPSSSSSSSLLSDNDDDDDHTEISSISSPLSNSLYNNNNNNNNNNANLNFII